MAKKKTKTRKAKKNTKDLVKKEHKYTDEERARLAKHQERAKRKPIKFKTVESDSGVPTIKLQEPDDPLFEIKLLESLGTPDKDIQKYLLEQVIHTFSGAASIDGTNTGKAVPSTNNALAILAGIQPKDELEAMLAVQMIGVHNMAMETLKRAMLSDQTFEGKQANVAQSTKMLRTFMAQMETLKKYRTGGQQKMIVEHVHVNEGGQAIVGTVNQGDKQVNIAKNQHSNNTPNP